MDTQDLKYTVEGRWQFPLDMLARDRAVAATPRDQALIDSLSRDLSEVLEDPGAGTDTGRVRIDLVIPEAGRSASPLCDRWESFGWRVVATSDPDFLTVREELKAIERERRRDRKLVASAMGKLTTDEFGALRRHLG